MRSSRYAQLEQLPLSTLVGSVTWIGPSSYSRLILDLHAMSPMVQRDRRFNATRRQVLVSGRDVVWQGKHALQHAFHAAKASLLICPDADCVRTANARELGLAKLVVICNTIAVSEVWWLHIRRTGSRGASARHRTRLAALSMAGPAGRLRRDSGQGVRSPALR